MKKFIGLTVILAAVLIISSIQTTLSLTGKWEIVDRRPDFGGEYQNSDYIEMKCADSLNCIVLAKLNGAGAFYLRHTSDGGNTWRTVHQDSGYFDFVRMELYPRLLMLSYPSKNLIIGAGDSGLIMRSTDNGETWEKQRYNDSIELFRIFMADDNYGFIQGDYYWGLLKQNKNVYLETTDGGKTWHDIPILVGLSQINFINSNLLCGFGQRKDSVRYYQTIVWVYNKWKYYKTFDRPGFSMWMHTLDSNNIWVSGDDPKADTNGHEVWIQRISHSSDGGRTWINQRNKIFDSNPIHELHFYNKDFGMVTGLVGLMLITFDGGKTWIEEYITDKVPSGSDYRMKSVQVVSPTTAFVIGSDDYVYKYTRDPVSVENQENKSEEFYISPNPASDYIEITYQQSDLSFPLIFNIFGEEVNLTPTLSRFGEGVRIDVSGLSPGMYFIKVGNKVSKFVKL